VALGVPVTPKLSPFTKPTYAAVPVKLAVNKASYTLLAPVKPVMVNALAATVLLAVATFTSCASVLVSTILPLYGEPATVAVANNLTKIVVEATVPLDWVKVTVPAYPEPIVVDTSNPDGGVITISLVSYAPDTVKLVGEALAVP
jgi:hypothetical protein